MALTLLTAGAIAAPVLPRHDGIRAAPPWLPVQAEAQVTPQQDAPTIAPAPTTPPPPMLPAPSLPGGTLAKEGDQPAGAVAPGLPVTANGAVFSFADLAERLLDSVVYISTSQRVKMPHRPPQPNAEGDQQQGGDDFFNDFFNDNGEQGSRNVQSLGSGFVIDPSGLIVTNNHVIADADEIVANFADGRKLEAEVVGIDEKTDLALLKVDAGADLQAAHFGHSEKMRVGDWVLAIGNPFGFGGTVTAGIVSALDRDINSGPYDHYIQTDASINRGNSGGPLFNINGEVVGINTAIMSPTGGSIGIGFAVPAEIAVPVIEQLRQFGKVRRGWIGVRIQDVTEEVAGGLGMAKAMGAFVAGLTPDGPADKAGIHDGDVVVEFDGKPVDHMRELPRLVADTPPGHTASLIVMRDGARVPLQIEVGLLQDEETQVASASTGDGGEGTPDKQAEDAAQMFGLKLGAITEDLRNKYSIDAGIQGVLVAGVDDGTEAAVKGVKEGEVIVQVSQKDVTAPDEVIARIEELKAEGRKTVMLLVSGEGNKLRFVSLRFADE